MLELVDLRDPGEEGDDGFQVIAPGAIGIGRGVELVEEGVGREFHRHGGDLGELHRDVGAIGEKRIATGQERVEGVTGLVDDGLDIALQACGVHEDEREADAVAVGLIAAGSLAAAGFEIQAGPIRDAVGRNFRPTEGVKELGRGRGVHAAEEPAGALDQVGGRGKGAQRRPAADIHLQIPRAQGA